MDIGIAPDTDGQVCPDDTKRLAEFGEWVRDFNSRDFAKGATVKEPRNGNTLTLDIALPEPVEINCVDIKEKIAEGQRVASFMVETPDGAGGWRVLARGTTVGHRRLARLARAKYGRFRVTLEGIAPPQVFPVALRRGREIAGEVLCAPDTYGKTEWRIVDETCAAPRNAKRAIDGSYSSLWHSHASGAAPLPPPQSFTVDCGKELPMHGFDYTPRMDGCKHGLVDGYEFHVSPDGKSWTKAAAGEFGNIAANPVRQRVTFEKPAKARYFRFTATHAVEANDRVAVAEIDIW
ncbi:MAG: discoidin domain-containing protein [Kiritimatiellae bacterium]|nr:discoidin domain-containing protein [Kiritimatiellia bacterium]